MIRQLTIENFRCLRAVTLNLEPLTVFVGANASGKSSVFAALRVGKYGDYLPADRWARDPKAIIRIAAQRDDGSIADRQFGEGSARTHSKSFPESQLLQFDLQQLRQPNQVQLMHRLESNGNGLANVLDSLPRSDQAEVARQFCRLVPMYSDLYARPQQNGHHWITFRDRWLADVWYEPHQVSDGSMLLLAFLLLPYQSPPPDVIAIEEPERGLHPFLMGELVRSLRRLANGEIGPRKVQVLLATHSAELLDFAEPREVRFFNRTRETGETRVQQAPLDDPSWKSTLREYDESLGDIWLSGGLGGVPSR